MNNPLNTNRIGFGTLLELKQILNHYSEAELSKIMTEDNYVLTIFEKPLSDSSISQDFIIENN